MKINIFIVIGLIISLTAYAKEKAILKNSSATDKTLIAWVTLETLEQEGGSVLTIQRGDQFDAIVYAEREPYRWMAGSDYWSRTQGYQFGNAAEDAGPNELVQVAIVYSGEQIHIYRQGDLYASYAAQNVSLMDDEYYIAVFGWRHIGAGMGTFAGSIEDARIYDQALNAEQISGLQPNETSEIDPIAWWDFEGDEIVDRAGLFSHHAMTDGVTLTNGRLHLDGQGYLVAALSEADALRATRAVNPRQPIPPFDPEVPAWPEDPLANWMTFHLAHPGPGEAIPGDPNPAFDYKGRYHLHYIYNHNGFNFAHVSSDDMVRWQWHPTVLSELALGHGMFSGTGFFTKDGTPAMIYHGEGSGHNWIRYALDDQLDSWSDAQAVIPLDEDGQEHPMEPGGHGDIRHWDPDLWLNNDTYYAYAGGENPQLMKSGDLENWIYIGDLFHPDYSPEDLGVSPNIDVSCGNMFKIGNKWMLLNIDHGSGCRYYLGDFKDEQYLPESHHRMSFGSDVYFAPETMLTRNGRRVMWAWLREPPVAPTGIQSLPRELELPEDGVLRIRPLQELASLRYDPISREAFTMAEGNEVFLEEITGDAIEMEVTFDWPLPEACGIDLLGSEYGTGSMRIIAGVGRNSVQVGTTKAPFTLKDGEDLTLRVFIDKNLVEVFINDRQAAVYVTPDIRENPNIHLFAEGGEATVKSLKAWKMNSIYIDHEESNTAIDLTPIQNEISVYPNPFTNMLTVNGKKDISNLKIYQIDGSLVYSKDFDSQSTIELSTENFESGIYILSIQTVDGHIGMKYDAMQILK